MHVHMHVLHACIETKLFVNHLGGRRREFDSKSLRPGNRILFCVRMAQLLPKITRAL